MSEPTPAIDRGLGRLETELRAARRFGARATKQVHAAVLVDLRRAEQRAKRAERRAVEAEQSARRAERRARRAERELAAVRASTTWRVGRAVVAVPARLRRRRR